MRKDAPILGQDALNVRFLGMKRRLHVKLEAADKVAMRPSLIGAAQRGPLEALDALDRLARRFGKRGASFSRDPVWQTRGAEPHRWLVHAHIRADGDEIDPLRSRADGTERDGHGCSFFGRPLDPTVARPRRPLAADSLAPMLYMDAVNGGVLVYDGAFGTYMQTKDLTAEDFGGPELEGCNEMLVLTRPDLVEEMHRAFLDVGVDVIETATFGAFSIPLNEYDIGDRAHEINLAAARIARAAVRLVDAVDTHVRQQRQADVERSLAVNAGVESVAEIAEWEGSAYTGTKTDLCTRGRRQHGQEQSREQKAYSHWNRPRLNG